MDTATDHTIQLLRSEAAAQGDTEQVTLCDLALNGDDVARRACAATLNAAVQAWATSVRGDEAK